MSRLIHLSDLHFGKDRPDLIVPLLNAVNGYAPDLVIISGDLTQRAREKEYRAARAFIDRVNAPVLSVPGNHDIPFHRPFTRFFAPWRYYRQWIARDLTPVHHGGDYVAVGINTVDRFKWQTGRLAGRRLRRACSALSGGAKETLRIAVCHHPLDHPNTTKKKPIPGAKRALRRLLNCGADLILSGHLHIWHAGTFAHLAAEQDGHRAIQLHAGTSLSSRQRGEPNDFNLIDVSPLQLDVARITYDDARGAFTKAEARQFNRASGEFIV
ncbi:metallophosphoesterase [Sulfitobacter sp. S0837]|uniref:metallophosphoesterase family protein n=1 Tax=Sulfitobacter maritimus TaxID=2741719 RepID=UPI00158212C6|nr:metallophosphoesterase [Sulfitobacter maritimus]NUH66895.1 metallophosphoesterase [Sulfitobacter maritimus]